MNLDPRVLFKGAVVVARRDLQANLRSVKVIVLSALMLLVMIGAAFGISGFSPTGPGTQNEYVMWAFPAYVGNNTSSAGAAVRVTDYAGAAKAGLSVELGYPYLPGQPNPSFRLKATNTTDGNGWTRFADLGPGLFPVQTTVGQFTQSGSVFIPAKASNDTFTLLEQQFDVLHDGSFRDVGLEAVLPDGRPLGGVPVFFSDTVRGDTTAQGFFGLRLNPGLYFLNLTYAGQTQTHVFSVREPTSLLPFELGPDFVLYFVAYSLMGLFAPIVAIALSYDALSKERLQGSLELLLVRPASRTGLAVGKFLGTFLSVGLPLLGVAIGALAGVAAVNGKWPDLGFDLAFLFGTLGLIAMYVLLMQIFSTIVKGPGTAILSGFMVWFVFNLLWNLIYVLVSAVLGIRGGTEAAFTLSTLTLLFNPTGVYQLTLAAFLPASLAAVGPSAFQLPDWTGPVAMLVWIVILLALAVYAFQKKIV